MQDTELYGFDALDVQRAVEQIADFRKLKPKFIQDSLDDLMNSGRIEDAKEIYNWLEIKLTERGAWAAE